MSRETKVVSRRVLGDEKKIGTIGPTTAELGSLERPGPLFRE